MQRSVASRRARILGFVVMALASVLPAFAQSESAQTDDSAIVPVAEYGALLTPLLDARQLRAWERLSNDTAKSDFVQSFWDQLDPTPGTAANERREIFEARARRAMEEFGDGSIPGYATDRGRVLLVYGLPDEQESRAVPTPTLTWRYTRHAPPFDVVFVERDGGLAFDESPELSSDAFLAVLGDDLRLRMVSSVGDGDRSLATPEPSADTGVDVFEAEPSRGPPPDLAPEVKIWMEAVFAGTQRDEIGLRQRVHFFPASQGTYVALSFAVDYEGLEFALPVVEPEVAEVFLDPSDSADPDVPDRPGADELEAQLEEEEEDLGPRADLRVFGAFLQGERGAEDTLHSFIVPHSLAEPEDDATVSGPLSLGVSLFPGSYRLVWGILDAGSGRAVTRDVSVEVPDLATGPLALTAPVLAATEVRDDTRPMSTEFVYEGLRLGNVLIANSIDGEFDRTDTVEVVVIATGWASDPGSPGKPRLEVTYRVLRGLEGDVSVARLPEQLLDFHVLGQQIPLAQVRDLRGGRSYRIEIRVHDLVNGAETAIEVPIHLRPEPVEEASN